MNVAQNKISISLPVRTEFGFQRTSCACRPCSIWCEHMPGYMIPADVPRMAIHLGYKNVVDFVREKCSAGAGAKVYYGGVYREVPNITPARKEDGTCVFLSADKKCTIHAVAPYGCAFFDSHMSEKRGDMVSSEGVRTNMQDFDAEGEYSLLWYYLHSLGKINPPVEQLRQETRDHWDREQELLTKETDHELV